jgi:hypothetical protein
VHGSNLILLFAYTRREMLSLRILALVAAVTIIPYYVVQPTVLWHPLFWSGVYGLVHSYHIVVLLLQRRPVELTPDEERLYAMSLSNLERGEFKHVMRFCTWRDAAPGARFEIGPDTVLLLTEGRVDAVLHGDRVSAFEPGDLLGIAFALAGAPGLELEAAQPRPGLRIAAQEGPGVEGDRVRQRAAPRPQELSHRRPGTDADRNRGRIRRTRPLAASDKLRSDKSPWGFDTRVRAQSPGFDCDDAAGPLGTPRGRGLSGSRRRYSSPDGPCRSGRASAGRP